MKTKYCWICGKYIPSQKFLKHKDEHYNKNTESSWMIDMPMQKQEKPFNSIKGLEKLK
jgi:hypothetical protein